MKEIKNGKIRIYKAPITILLQQGDNIRTAILF